MTRTILFYALALALALALAAALQWLEYRYLMRSFSTEVYVALLAIGFATLGLWAGRWLTPPPPRQSFRHNDAAIRSLGITPRECEILGLLATDQSIKEMARALGIVYRSPSSRFFRSASSSRWSRRCCCAIRGCSGP